MKKNRLACFFLACILLCIIGIPGCKTQPEQKPHLRIVTSFYPMYISTINLTKDIPGIRVENMAGQQAGCLHDYQLQSSDMQELEAAAVFVINGAGMESFLDKVIEQLPSLRVIDASEGIPLLEENAHVWVSLSGCMEQVRNIADGLKAADPAHASDYETNATVYLKKLSALQDKMHQALDPLPNREIVTMHEAFPYFAEEFHLHIAGVVNREPDSQPSAKELAETIDLIRQTGVTAVFAEPQYSVSAADIIAAESGVSVYTLDPASTGDDDPDAYLHAMESNLAVLKTALQKTNQESGATS